MRFTVTIQADNAAFGETLEDRETEIVLILHRLIRAMQDEHVTESVLLLDTNGNRVGEARWTNG